MNQVFEKFEKLSPVVFFISTSGYRLYVLITRYSEIL